MFKFNFKRRYSFKYVLLELFLVFTVVIFINPFKSVLEDMWISLSSHLSYISFTTFKIVFILYFIKLTSTYYWRDEFYIPKFKFKFIFKALWFYLLFFLSLILFSLFLSLLLNLLKKFYPELMSFLEESGFFKSEFNWAFPTLSSVVMMFFTSIFTGFYEELLYRAFFITKLNQIGLNRYFALIIASIFFGLSHLYYGFLGGVVALILGFILGFIYLKNKNIYIASIFHSLNNSIVALLTYIDFQG